jgi:ankyrin repeat protein
MSLPSYLSLLPPLHQAAALGNLCLVETLCADFDIQEPFRSRRPLDWACWHGQIEAARFLLDSGDDGRPSSYDPQLR